MTMTRKQLKALRRHKRLVKERNIRTNNLRINPWRESHFSFCRKHSYRLYNI